MSDSFEREPSADPPEPDEALAGSAAETPDHAAADADDRVLELDDPEGPEPAFDDDDRDPAGSDETFPGAPS